MIFAKWLLLEVICKLFSKTISAAVSKNRSPLGLVTVFFEKLVLPAGIKTLETRHSDSLDFHEVSVWRLREMLMAAYQHGWVEGGRHGK